MDRRDLPVLAGIVIVASIIFWAAWVIFTEAPQEHCERITVDGRNAHVVCKVEVDR